MAQLYVANINFESTGNTQIVYTANPNTITFRAGSTILTSNSEGIVNAAGKIFQAVSVSNAQNYVINSTSGSLTVNNSLKVFGAIIYSGVNTATAIAANTADYNPNLNVYNIQVSGNNNTANSEYMITGITAGTNGQIVILNNTGPMGIWIRNEESGSNGAILAGINTPGSTAANRFNIPNHFKLQGYQSAKFYYDGTSQRWRLIDSSSIPFDHKEGLTKGFFAGGATPTVVATADRTTYSTETTAAVPGANLSQARNNLAAAGNACKGFFAGGSSPTFVATADRTTYSTETTAAVVGANLSQARSGARGVGNACKGFFGGGTTPTPVACTRLATTDRTTYSTEATAAVPGANLSQVRSSSIGAGNACKGFFIGGVTPTVVAVADRTTYSTETTAAVVGANLSQARNNLAAAGNSDKGFFSGGATSAAPGIVATADRTTYSTETTAAVPGANLSQARSTLAAAGNSCKGFFSGGNSAPVAVTTADRTTYLTEVTAAVPGANLSQARIFLSAI